MKKIFVAGHNGMVARAITSKLRFCESTEVFVAERDELDLTSQSEVKKYFNQNKFDQVYLAAAKVGGIISNSSYPAGFIYQNLMIQNNVIHHAYEEGVGRLLFLGSSCIYPRNCPQPIEEKYLLSGELEKTNEAYAIAKISGIKMCESYNIQYGVDFRSVMPTNLYGPNDNFHPKNSHVVPGLINRFHNAKINNENVVTIWGSGEPLREFLHVDDLASASIYVMNIETKKYKKSCENHLSHINVGSGKEISIRDLAMLIKKIVGFRGDINFDNSKPDGTPRKLLNIDKLNKLGWEHSITFEDGLKKTYEWYIENINNLRKV